MEYSRRDTYGDVGCLQTEWFPVSSLPGYLSVSFTQESSCSLPSKDNFFYNLHNITNLTILHSTNQNLKMASPCPALGSPSEEGITNVPRSDCPSADDLGCLDTSSNTSTLDFCNIPGLRFNFQYVEHYISCTKPHILFLTETQLSVTTDGSPFSVLSFFLYPHFQFKAGCCAYVRNDISCSRAPNLESPEFSTIWLRLQCRSLTMTV